MNARLFSKKGLGFWLNWLLELVSAALPKNVEGSTLMGIFLKFIFFFFLMSKIRF